MGRRLRIILSDVVDDARHAVRMLARNRAFTVVVVAALALGIGATTAIFTVVNSVLLRPLRYRDAGRIVSVATRWKGRSTLTPRMTGGDLVDVAIEASDFSAFSSYFGGEVGVQVGGRGEFTGVYWINPGFLRVFSVPPVGGRPLEENDAGSAAMVSLRSEEHTSE